MMNWFLSVTECYRFWEDWEQISLSGRNTITKYKTTNDTWILDINLQWTYHKRIESSAKELFKADLEESVQSRIDWRTREENEDCLKSARYK